MNRSLIILFALLLAAPLAGAAEVYVNDYLVITLRAGKGDEYKILKSLPSGTALEVVATDGEFTQVRTKDGIEGWVRSQYLSDKPVARELVDQYGKKLELLEAENKKLKESLSQVSREAKQLTQDQKRIETEKEKMEREHAQIKEIAARPMELEAENKTLSSENVVMRAELERLRKETAELKENEMQKWFLAGGGVFLAGIFAGLILPRFRSRRQSGWI